MLKILEMIGFASEMMLRIAGIIFCAVLLGIIVWFIVSLGHDDAAVAERPERVSITLDDHSAPVAAEDVEQTIRELFQACPGARDNWVDVTSATIKLNSEEDVLDRRDYWPVDTYGWTNYYELTMKISDDPVSVHYRAASHTLHYMIGWGGTPGLTMPKDAGMHFCGLPFDPSPNSYFVPWNFTPVQELH